MLKFMIKIFIFYCLVAMGFVTNTHAVEEYDIEFSKDDEVFIINGERFEAKIACTGWDTGDSVVFIEGDPYGTCVSATLFNLDRKEKCEVWCE